MRSKILVGCVGVSCILIMWLITSLYQELLEAYEQSGSLTDIEYSWFFRLLLNLAGYSTILVPGFILYKYLQKTNYFDKISNQTCLSRCLFACFGPNAERLPESARGSRLGAGPGEGEGPPSPSNTAREGAELAFCFTGLMGAYLVWGLLQEKIMTQSYVLSDGRVVRFNDSQFLVLVNRLVALVVAVARLLCLRTPVVAAPLYQFSYCALTNVLSAWCQYEALKYVSFPTQVLSKSCKVIPVMLMGAVISRNKYAAYEYVTAALISLGMVLFMFGTHHEGASASAGAGVSASASGMALLCVYMVCDSFTSSWQSALFARTRCAPLQMLAAVNVFSCALTAAALPHRPAATARSLALMQSPAFAADCFVLSASSALGQLLIYRTISRFGAVVFTIIMTARQAVSILLSCIVYGHEISWGGVAGVALVFTSIFLRVYCRQRIRHRTKPHAHTHAHTHAHARTDKL